MIGKKKWHTPKRKKRIDWTKEEEDLLREHLKDGGGFSWASMRELVTTLGRTIVAAIAL